jgi:hypothetical protein
MDDFFGQNGFFVYSYSETKIVYYKKNLFFEISCRPKHSQYYSLLIMIGFIKNINDDSVFDGVGLWYGLPRDFDYSSWKFSNQYELKKTLPRVCNDIDQYAKPLWEDPSKLRELIDKYWREDKFRREKETREKNQKRAREAYKAGQFGLAISIYEEMGIENLNDVDLKMYGIAKKKK